MAEPTDRLPFDDAFDDAFQHLLSCRSTYEANPRDPAAFASLGEARAKLEDARTAMNAERERLGLAPRQVNLPPVPHVDSDGREEWQGVYQD